jgi:hypothetical protein
LSTVTEQVPAFHVSASSPAFFCPMQTDPVTDLDTVKKPPILKHDPSLGIKRPKLRKIRSRTDDEIAQFKRRWPLGTKPRTAFQSSSILASPARMWCGWLTLTLRQTKGLA